MINSQKYREILKEYEDLRDEAKRKLDARKNYIYEKIQEIKEIDDNINLTSINIAKAVISIPKEERDNFIKNLKEQHSRLLSRKKQLLLENGFSEDYLSETYSCSKCEDTGYINNEKCECFKQKIIYKVYDMYKLKEKLEKENFERFNFELFSREFDPSNAMSPYENIKLIFKIVQNFIQNFDDNFENIVFYGPAGVGKTFLCNCIAKELLEQGKTVIYTTAFELFSLIESHKFNKENVSSNKMENLELITEADLLIIDDLGTEFITILSSSELFNIINSRILQSKSTIISTNLEPDSLMSQYSSRVVSRFYGHYEMIKVFGQDIRMTENFKNLV